MIICGDCLEVMRGMEANSVDAIVTDPPYGLSFMGKDWDHGIPGESFWAEALRVAKPGAHLLAFGGTRTFHRLTCAIEDAGWEIRDCLGWIYGSGFPKSLDVSKAIDKAAGAERALRVSERWAEKYPNGPGGNLSGDGRSIHYGQCKRVVGNPLMESVPATDAARQWEGWGTALKPAWEPIILARKPLDGLTVAANVLKWGTGAVNVDGCRVPSNGEVANTSPSHTTPQEGWDRPWRHDAEAQARTYAAKQEGNRKAVALGRWPANLIHDGSEEVLELFPQTGPGMFPPKRGDGQVFGKSYGSDRPTHKTDSGSAARFFYCAKASRKEREMGCEGMEERTAPDAHNLSSNACAKCGKRVKANGSGDKCECGGERITVKLPAAKNHHPTVKPLALMRYLCRLVTPPNGLVLDPFVGSGTTLIAAEQEGFRAVGIEMNEEYCEIAKRRIYGTLPSLEPLSIP